MKKTILVFTLLIVALYILVRLSKYTLLVGETSIEFIIAAISIGIIVSLLSSLILQRKN